MAKTTRSLTCCSPCRSVSTMQPVDAVIGIVPIVGDVFDVVWKANRKNIALLTSYLEQLQDLATADSPNRTDRSFSQCAGIHFREQVARLSDRAMGIPDSASHNCRRNAPAIASVIFPSQERFLNSSLFIIREFRLSSSKIANCSAAKAAS